MYIFFRSKNNESALINYLFDLNLPVMQMRHITFIETSEILHEDAIFDNIFNKTYFKS
jgi:hypothetical protein